MSWSELDAISEEMNPVELDHLVRMVKIENPIRMLVTPVSWCDDDAASVEMSIHDIINNASGGILTSLGVPYVECSDQFILLTAQLSALQCLVSASPNEGYLRPNFYGYLTEFVIPASILKRIITEIKG